VQRTYFVALQSFKENGEFATPAHRLNKATAMAWQKVVRVRREYNQWVANQTLEDYALRFTAKSARKWSALRVANTALGAISFLALEAIGGTITLSDGFSNAVPAILAVGLLIAATALPISYYAAKFGVDIDLLTRGAGFGYVGTTVTSLIYASFTFIFFAIESVIMATALEIWIGVPLMVGYVFCSLIIIPLVTHGITFISRFQLWTQPIWLVLHILPFVFIALSGDEVIHQWSGFPGRFQDSPKFDPLLFGAAASVVFSLVAQIGEQVDFLRFLPRERKGRRIVWWIALLSAGPGWVVIGVLKLFAGSFLAVLAVRKGLSYTDAATPMKMYVVAFHYIVTNPAATTALAAVFVIVSQLKINVTNAYAGSIAWSNFFSRLTHSHPGRVVWLVFNVALALLLMELGVYRALERVLGLYSILASAWVGALVADLVINKPLKLSPPFIEFRRAHLYDINPVGVGAMLIAVIAAVLAFSGDFGTTAQAFSPFAAFFVAFVSAPTIAYATQGKYYLARKSRRHWAAKASIQCSICELNFEPEDMAFCPAYSGPICSLCCSLDARCNDSCKTSGRLRDQALIFLNAILPKLVMARLNSRVIHYLGVLLLLGSVIGTVLAVIYAQTRIEGDAARNMVRAEFWKIFFIQIIIAGVASWLFVLAQESRKVAQEESRRQTNLLMHEINAHQRTDAKLQKAKEAAESANLAKTRYIVGISHEFRTPLNVILGYAQLLDLDTGIPQHRRDGIKVIRRSGEHLTSLIEGLLDISKIEAGRLNLYRNEVKIVDFLDQIADMFRLQASAKGIEFHFEQVCNLPIVVYTDEKRLRQVLINLLSNAIKFTDAGNVTLRVHYRNQVAEFEVADSGIGIRPEDIERIFEPFERGDLPNGRAAPGMGLGLTIAKLLTEIMGGEILVNSEPGVGSVFHVRLALFKVENPRALELMEDPIFGYRGRRLSILVADDDAGHRDMIREILTPLGFIVFDAPDGLTCARLAAECKPDLVLLDISMPGMNGWDVARLLRRTEGNDVAILLISADANELNRTQMPHDLYDEYLVKPIDIQQLLDRIGWLLKIEWLHQPPSLTATSSYPVHSASIIPSRRHINDLHHLGQIGFIRGIHAKLDEIERDEPDCRILVSQLRALVKDFDLNRYMSSLEALQGNDSSDEIA
jgi:signal transduction histidine kinase